MKNDLAFSHITLACINTFPNIKIFLLFVLVIGWLRVRFQGRPFLKNIIRAAVTSLKKFKKMNAAEFNNFLHSKMG